ncbi:hypothetical protein [Streptomyces sp. NPDC059063]|uniref:hypothetical protein n=1 Tax=Streptomyces sp. NPDC059063 TaxID=3346712 RepID=UPI0036D0B1B7
MTPTIGFATLADAYWMASDSPIYDTVERRRLRRGQEASCAQDTPAAHLARGEAASLT